MVRNTRGSGSMGPKRDHVFSIVAYDRLSQRMRDRDEPLQREGLQRRRRRGGAVSSTYLNGTLENRKQVHRQLLSVQFTLLFIVVVLAVLFMYISEVEDRIVGSVKEQQTEEQPQRVQPIRTAKVKPKVL